MKKFIFFFTLSLSVITTWAFDFSAVAPSGQTLYYTITSDSTVEVLGEFGAISDSLIIPSTVVNDGVIYSVTSIGETAFFYCNGLTSVEIPNSVTRIGNYAFYNCSNLRNVEIGNSVTIIGSASFYRCLSLTSLTLPNSVTIIDEMAFSECDGLTNVTLSDSLTSIGTMAFSECSNLTNITLPHSLTGIGMMAFSHSGLTSLVLPQSVTSIGEGAFAYCSNLVSLAVEEGNRVFDSREGCNAIIETATNTLVLGTQNTIIPNFVASIGNQAFNGCSGLISVTIPNAVTSIGKCAFGGCNGLTSLVVEDGNSVYDSRENCNAVIQTATNTLVVGTQNTIIPNTVTSIGYGAFHDLSTLTSVTIPNSVTSIEEQAFLACTGLSSISIPNSVTRIGVAAFRACSGLTNVTIGNSVSIVDSGAFCYCRQIDSIICNAVVPPMVADSTVFEEVDRNLTLIVPGESVSRYQSAYGWSEFTNIIGSTEGIEDVSRDYKVFTNNGAITISGAVGQMMRIYDIHGRIILSSTAVEGKTYTMPSTGIYLLQLGNHPAQRVLVVE